MTTRSAPELVDAVYDVLRKYLECAVGESSRMQAMIQYVLATSTFFGFRPFIILY